ncbi:hypothetical protein Celaphus_00010109 [Cervus elaphus hippelaphus]|uniref:Uncharacterized protein n=1 Tax=Cervus elaphus hippelaphus TaxID=46360 RepID=A0A212C0B5_CEREH|nr:hypothetical protein Celaphus_00010109 [Cervus elaphus hippelaphus]
MVYLKIRTRIPAYDDDNIVLYAYEPNTAYFSNQETAASETSYNEEEQGTIQDIFIHCQAIYDAIQDLDKKFDIIHGKVSKIHRYRCRMKSMWQSRLICAGFVSFQKLHGHRYKKYNCQHSRKSKRLKRKRRDLTSSLSLTESYSPTIPVNRQDNDSQSNTSGIPIESQKSPEREQESFIQDQEPDRNLSPGIPAIFTQPYEPYEYTQEESRQVPSYYDSPQAHSTTNFFTPNQAAVIPTASILTQMEPEPIPTPDVVTYPPLFDTQPSRRNSSPPYTPNTYGEYELTPVIGSIIYPIVLSTWMQVCGSCLFLILSTSLG